MRRPPPRKEKGGTLPLVELFITVQKAEWTADRTDHCFTVTDAIMAERSLHCKTTEENITEQFWLD